MNAIKHRNLVLSFLFPFCIMMSVLMYRGVYPFGDNSFLHMDMYHQYMPFFAELLHKLKNGESLYYSWNIGLGSNFLALFAYYLASPVNWLVFFFPESHLMEFMTYLIVLKIAFCGTAFFLFLRYHFRKEKYSMVLFSCFYALSGFIAAYNWDIMWLDNVILAPLIILGLEKLFYEKKYRLYTITLGMSILSDYYLSIMICIFVVFYFGILLVEEPKHYKRILPFAGCSLLAGGLAGVLLVPVYFALRLSEFTQFTFPKKISSYFSMWDIVARHFMNVTTEQKLDHWPNIYCGVGVFLLVPMYVLNRKIRGREKVAKLGLLLFFLMSFTINILVLFWHGLNYPDSLPARQSFLYIFLVLVICYEAWMKFEEITPKVLGGCFAGAAVFLLLCEKLIGYGEDFSLKTYYATGFFLVLYAGLFYLYYRYGKEVKIRRRLLISATVLVLLETGINMADTSVSVTDRTAYLEDLDAYETLVSRTRQNDPGFYRFEKWKRTTKNDGALAGYPMASVFSSTANSCIGDLYEIWGMGHSKVFYCFDGATPLTSALLNVKYMFSEEPLEDPGGLYEKQDEQDGVYLYICKETLPIAFMLPDGFVLPQTEEEKGKRTPFAVQNAMVRGLLDGADLFEPAVVRPEEDGASVFIEEAGYYYVFPQSKKAKNMAVFVDGRKKEYKNMGNGYILPVGYVEPGTQVRITCEEELDAGITAWRMKSEKLALVIEKLGAQPFVTEDYTSNSVRGHIGISTSGILLFSIPYEPGWQVKVDGKKARTEAYANALIGIELEAGEHVVELWYFPQGLKAGIGISLFTLFLLIAITLPGAARLRRHKNLRAEEENETAPGRKMRNKENGSGNTASKEF